MNTGNMCDKLGTSYHQNGQGNQDLAVWFTAKAIREHYEGAEEDPTLDMTDEELESVGNTAWHDDYLWDAYGQVVGDAITRFTSSKIKQEEREGGAT